MNRAWWLLLLLGCSTPKPTACCLQSHLVPTVTMVPFSTGKVMFFMPITGSRVVCDEWGPLNAQGGCP